MRLYAEKRKYFPDPAKPTLDGIVAMGDDLNTETLLEAYSFGIFPWPHPELPCLWFCPDQRGIIDFSELHISRSLNKLLKKEIYYFTYNTAFPQVIRECAKVPRPGQDGTWITPNILQAYEDFHRAGYAHSIECWRGDDLVAGLYGVYVGGLFSGESMFYKESNTSKLCLIKTIEMLIKKGHAWMDIQMITPVTAAMGGKYINKKEFLARLAETKDAAKAPLFFTD